MMRPERSKACNLALRVLAVCALVLAGWSRMAASAESFTQGFDLRSPAAPRASGGSGAIPGASVAERASAATTTQPTMTELDIERRSSLDAVKRYADEHNPAIRAAVKAWEAAQKRIVIDRSYENPMIEYMPDTYNMAETRAGSQTGGGGFSQAIPFPGKLTLRGKIAAQEAEAARENVRAVVQETARRVWMSYAGYYLADRALEVNDETTQLARQFESIAEAKYKVGKVPEQDVIQSQVEISQLAVQRVDLQKARNTALGNLNSLLDRDPRAPVGRPAELAPGPLSTPLEQFVGESRAASPELKAEEYMVKSRETSVTLAKMGYLPDFSVGGQYIGVASNGVPGFIKNGHDIWAATIGFSVPIWLDRVKAQVDQANAQFLQEKSTRRNVENTVADQVQDAYERVTASARNEAIYRTTLMPQTVERIAAARAGYQTGIVDFLTLIDSLKSYEDVRMRRYETIEQYQAAAADLSRAVGQPIFGVHP
jgi:cobalt-zinc-cadmium efflux system outer membrane protein